MTLARSLLLTLVLVLGFSSAARAQVGSSYVSLSLESLRTAQAMPLSALPGFSVDFGVLQGPIFGTGTRISLQRNLADGRGYAIGLLGGPQFHVPLGDKLLLIPAFNLGLRLQGNPGQAGINFGYAAFADLMLAYRQDDYYFGASAQTPIILDNIFLPPVYSAALVAGMYYR